MTHNLNHDADAFVSCRKYKKRTNKFQVKKQKMLQMLDSNSKCDTFR